MEEFKDIDFKWCDSFFGTHQNEIFENVLNDPEIQNQIDESWNNLTVPTDSSNLVSSIVLDNWEPHENTSTSDCRFKCNEEPEIGSLLPSQLNEDHCDRPTSSALALNDAKAVNLYLDMINSPNNNNQLQSIICEDYSVLGGIMSEVNSKLIDHSDDNVPSVSDLLTIQPEVLETSSIDNHALQKKKCKTHDKRVCDKRRIRRTCKSKNYKEILPIQEYFPEINSNSISHTYTTYFDENAKIQYAKFISNSLLGGQEKLPSHLLNKFILLDQTQNEVVIKDERRESKQPRRKGKNNSKQGNLRDCNFDQNEMKSTTENGNLNSLERMESISKSLDFTNCITNITTTPTTSSSEKINESVKLPCYVLTSDSGWDDSDLTFFDVQNLEEPGSSHLLVREPFLKDEKAMTSKGSSQIKEEYFDSGWSNLNSSELLKESEALETAVKELQHSITVMEDSFSNLEKEYLEIKSLSGKRHKFKKNQLYKILEHVISEVHQTSLDELSLASAIVRILMSYAEEKNL